MFMYTMLAYMTMSIVIVRYKYHASRRVTISGLTRPQYFALEESPRANKRELRDLARASRARARSGRRRDGHDCRIVVVRRAGRAPARGGRVGDL
jgi:hypothetical protein